MAFKRASLSGSAQLFQPTRLPTPVAMDAYEDPPPPPPPKAAEEDSGRLYRLNDEEVESVLAALQQAKFPHSYQRLPKPPLEEFEQLEALRQKLIRQREDRF